MTCFHNFIGTEIRNTRMFHLSENAENCYILLCFNKLLLLETSSDFGDNYSYFSSSFLLFPLTKCFEKEHFPRIPLTRKSLIFAALYQPNVYGSRIYAYHL